MAGVAAARQSPTLRAALRGAKRGWRLRHWSTTGEPRHPSPANPTDRAAHLARSGRVNVRGPALRAPALASPPPTPATLTPSCPPQDGLGLPRGASKAAVKRRYFELAKALHPDHGGGGGAEPRGPAAAPSEFGRATEMYERLVKIAPRESAADQLIGARQPPPPAGSPSPPPAASPAASPTPAEGTGADAQPRSATAEGPDSAEGAAEEARRRVRSYEADARARAAGARLEAEGKVTTGRSAASRSIRSARHHAQRLVRQPTRVRPG